MISPAALHPPPWRVWTPSMPRRAVPRRERSHAEGRCVPSRERSLPPFVRAPTLSYRPSPPLPPHSYCPCCAATLPPPGPRQARVRLHRSVGPRPPPTNTSRAQTIRRYYYPPLHSPLCIILVAPYPRVSSSPHLPSYYPSCASLHSPLASQLCPPPSHARAALVAPSSVSASSPPLRVLERRAARGPGCGPPGQ